jgi:hypothetical protein
MTINRPTLNLQAKGSIYALNGVPPGMTFTRALGTATRTNAQGLIEPVAADVLRHGYNPATKEYKGWLIEGTRTNIILYSEVHDNAAWNSAWRLNARTAAAAVSPDGSTNAYLIQADTSSSIHWNRQAITKAASAIVYTYSMYVKRVSPTTTKYAYLSQYDGSSGEVYARFDLSTGTVDQTGNAGTAVFGSASMIYIGNDWWRCIITGTSSTTTSVQPTIFVGDEAQGSYTTAYVGVLAVNQIYTWGAQLETGVVPSSYIPTTTIAATRSADALSTTDLSWLDTADTEVGTFVSVSSKETIEAIAAEIYSLDPGNTNNRIHAYIKNTGSYQFQTEGTAPAYINPTITPAAGEDVILAGSYSNDLVNAACNGTLGTLDTDADLPLNVTPTIFRIGWQSNGFEYNGYIKSIRYWPSRLTDEELIELTL